MFSESPVSKSIWKYFNDKYGQMTAPIGLAKACSIVSPKTNSRYTSNVFVVAPTRQFKSITSLDASQFFPKNQCIRIGSDFTMHDIVEHYKDKIDKRCMLINDGTLLLTSKSRRTRDRLINGIAELLADGRYRYGDRLSQLEMEGRVSVIMNMTSEMYEHNKNDLLGSTFLERFITLFYLMPIREQRDFLKNKESRRKMRPKTFKKRLKKPKKSVIFGDFYAIFTQISEDLAILSGKSLFGTDDQIKAIAVAHAYLNGRSEICQDDVDFITSLRQYYNNPFAPNEHKIIQFAKEGRSQKDICLLLNMSPEKYRPYVSRVIKTAKLRGLLTW